MDRAMVKTVTDKNDGPVVIVAALINPPGLDEAGGEWVELKNAGTEAIDLMGWEMHDKMARSQKLSGILEPNATGQFAVTRSNPYGMQLGNKGGIIVVRDRNYQEVETVKYPRARSGEVLRFS